MNDSFQQALNRNSVMMHPYKLYAIKFKKGSFNNYGEIALLIKNCCWLDFLTSFDILYFNFNAIPLSRNR